MGFILEKPCLSLYQTALEQQKDQPKEPEFDTGTIDWEGTKRGRTGWQRWVRPVLMGLSLLAVLLIILLLAWYGLLPI